MRISDWSSDVCSSDLLQRLEKIMDEYVGGISAHYTTNEPMLTRGIELLGMLREDLAHIGAEDLHQLQRAWELHHRVLASACVTQHTLFRPEARWPGYSSIRRASCRERLCQ